MYYSEDVIEEVRSRNDIVDVISTYVKLKRQGANYFGLCPFHGEKTPSFSVSPSKQIFYCFGCGAGGNVITFIEKIENYTFPEAVRYLARRAGMELPEESYSEEERKKHDRRQRILNVQKMAATYYYYRLRSPEGAEGMDYLKKRGLSDETMKNFGLGYAGKYSDSLYRYLRSKDISDSILKDSGLFGIDHEKMYDKFWNRVMFPIMDLNNRVIGFGGRVMGDGKPKYLNSPETEIFNKRKNMYGLNVARRTRRGYLIVCEGYMDVISMHQAGFTNAVASLGTSLTEEHCVLLKRFTQNVILSYDSDEAGVRAALRAIPMVKNAGLVPKILHLDPYKDPDEFIKARGAEEFEKRLEEAQPSFYFELDQLEKQFDMKDPEDKTRFIRKAAEKTAAIEDEIERENCGEAFCRHYSISVSGFKNLVNRAILSGAADSGKGAGAQGKAEERPLVYSSPQKREDKRESGIRRSEAMLLTWLCEYPGFYGSLKKYVQPEDFSDRVTRKVAKLLYAQLGAGKPDPAKIVDQFEDPDDQSAAARLFNTKVDLENDDETEQAMRETIGKVMDASVSRKDDELQTDPEELQRSVEKIRLKSQLNSEKFNLAGNRS